MGEVVELGRKPVDAELVESLRTLLSNAQAGRLSAFIAVCLSDDGELDFVLHGGPNNFEAIGMASWLHAQMIELLKPE